jgi:hypothetical protein
MRHDQWASLLVESAHPALRACAIIITSFLFAGDMKRLSSNNGPWGPESNRICADQAPHGLNRLPISATVGTFFPPNLLTPHS